MEAFTTTLINILDRLRTLNMGHIDPGNMIRNQIGNMDLKDLVRELTVNFEVYDDDPDNISPDDVTRLDEDINNLYSAIVQYEKTKDVPLSLNIVDEETTDETSVLECKICTINKVCVALTSCGHTFCYTCTTRFNKVCAVCRAPFANNNVIHIFI
jgi:hypothetical protein